MPFQLIFQPEAISQLQSLEKLDEKKFRKVRKCLGFLENDPRYPALNSHKFLSLRGQNGEDIWESYVENNVPSAWRLFWHYGPGKDVITVIAILPHP